MRGANLQSEVMMLRTLAAVERGGAGAVPQLLPALLDPAARDARPAGPSAMERRCREAYARRPYAPPPVPAFE